jgi:hypothetical protein
MPRGSVILSTIGLVPQDNLRHGIPIAAGLRQNLDRLADDLGIGRLA